MMPNHHPPAEWLLGHASGTLTEAEDLLLAAHCTLCPDCRAGVRAQEEAAGAALADLAPAPVGAGALDAILGRLGEQEAAPTPPAPSSGTRVLPQPVRDYIGAFEALSWGFVMPGIRQVVLPVSHEQMPVRLFHLAPGLDIPLHTHQGLERTLVLAGSYTDQDGTFARGDVGIQDGSADHRQRIDDGEVCIALVVADGPLVPRTAAGRVISWLSGA